MTAEIIDFGEHTSGSDEERQALERQFQAHMDEIYRLGHMIDALIRQPPKAAKE